MANSFRLITSAASRMVRSSIFSNAQSPTGTPYCNVICKGYGTDSKDQKPGDKAVEKPAVKPGEKPGEKPVDKPGDKAVEKPAEKPGEKPGEKPVDKPGDKTVEKPAEKPGEKPGEKPVDKPGDKAGEKPAEKPGDKAEGKPVEKHVEYGVTRAVFNFMDTNGDGCLSTEDLDVGLRKLMSHLPWAQNDKLEEIVKKHEGECFDYDAMMKHIYHAKELTVDKLVDHAFDSADSNKDGKVSKEELKSVALFQGFMKNEVADNVINEIYKLADVDKDGNLSKDEFRNSFYGALGKLFKQV